MKDIAVNCIKAPRGFDPIDPDALLSPLAQPRLAGRTEKVQGSEHTIWGPAQRAAGRPPTDP
eukprot:4010311-Heterocapsa_arctica.AAC.1